MHIFFHWTDFNISPLTYNGDVKKLTWPQVTDIKNMRYVSVSSYAIKYQMFENIPLRIVGLVWDQTFLEVRSRGVKIFTQVVEKMGGKLGENPVAFPLSVKKLKGRRLTPPPPPGTARVKGTVPIHRSHSYHFYSKISLNFQIIHHWNFWLDDVIWKLFQKKTRTRKNIRRSQWERCIAMDTVA